jgi:acyl carrier protein phosphodiesterase
VNFLAHIYLSGNSRDVLIGNFIGDYVKGKHYQSYPPGIRKGILLHRRIDSYTDHHPITRASKKMVSERFGLYSGIVVDIFYDHFLSSRWNRYAGMPLQAFVRDRYRMLDSGFAHFPGGVKNWFPYFIKSNWLETYTSFEGLEMVFRRMSYRTSLPEHSEYAVEQLEENYIELGEGFTRFFGEMCAYVQDEAGIILPPSIS